MIMTLDQLLTGKNNHGQYDDDYSYIHGRRAYCKGIGLSGKEFRECKRALREEDSGLSLKEKRDRAIERKLGTYDSPSFPNPNLPTVTQEDPSVLQDGTDATQSLSESINAPEKEITPKPPAITKAEMDRRMRMQEDAEGGMSKTAIVLTISISAIVVIGATILLVRYFRKSK